MRPGPSRFGAAWPGVVRYGSDGVEIDLPERSPPPVDVCSCGCPAGRIGSTTPVTTGLTVSGTIGSTISLALLMVESTTSVVLPIVCSTVSSIVSTPFEIVPNALVVVPRRRGAGRAAGFGAVVSGLCTGVAGGLGAFISGRAVVPASVARGAAFPAVGTWAGRAGGLPCAAGGWGG